MMNIIMFKKEYTLKHKYPIDTKFKWITIIQRSIRMVAKQNSCL